ncbi:MAG: autotransporter domain-containing protein [Xanthobacteraceae bacterium]
MRIGRGRLSALLASSSVAALLVGGGAPAAYAACNTSYNNETTTGCTNSGAITGIAINNSTITSTITNSGTISPNGIVLTNGSTITGFSGIIDTGTINGGISVDGTSKISATSDAIGIFGPTFTGGITNSGTLHSDVIGISIGNNSPFPTFLGGVTNSGTIEGFFSGIELTSVAQFGNTAGGGITNTGEIQAGTKAIFVRSVSTFFGGISNSGTISVGGFYPGLVVAGIAVEDVSAFVGGITNTGTISGYEGIYVTGAPGANVFDSGTIVGTSGTAVDMSLNSAGNTFTLGPGYAITGLVKGTGFDTFQLGGSGNAAFNLSLIGTQYTGFTTFNVVGDAVWTATGTYAQSEPWTVQSGTFLVDGDLSNASQTTVNGGTLGGYGTVGNSQINAYGTLAPGAQGSPSAGSSTLTISGNLAFQSGAFYLVQVNPTLATNANVSGTAALAGTVETVFSPGSYVVKSYDILHAAGGLGGTTFSGLTGPAPVNFTDSLSYTATDVYLNLIATLGSSITPLPPLNANQQSVVNALNAYFDRGGALPPNFVPIFALTGAPLANALTQLDGEAATGAERGAFELMTDFMGLMLDPFANGRGDAGGAPSSPVSGFAPDEQDAIALPFDITPELKPWKPNFDQRWTAWGSAYGGSNTANGDPVVGSTDVTASAYGFAAGMDYHFTPDTLFGFALGGGGTNWGLSQSLGSGRSDAFQAGVYGITKQGPAYLATALAFSGYSMSTDRVALGDQLDAKFNAQSYGARMETGYRIAALPAVGVTPYAAAQAQAFYTPSYSETDLTGGGFGLTYDTMTATDIRTELGARFDNLQIVNGMPVVLRARLAWAHDWVSNPSINAVFETLPGANFTVNGAPIAQNSALASAAAEWHLTANWTAMAKFDSEIAAGSQTYAGTGTLRYSW